MRNLFLLFSLMVFELIYGGNEKSSFTKIDNDIIISNNNPYAVITKKIKLDKSHNVLVVADGTLLPYTQNGIARINIQINNSNNNSNYSTIDWTASTNPVQHTFNNIASIKLSKGTHIIKLIAYSKTPNSNFKVGKGTGMSILVDAAPYMVSSQLEKESATINYKTFSKTGKVPLPMANVLTNNLNLGNQLTNVVTLGSGSVSRVCGEGDALWGLFLNDEICTNNANASWSVNDVIKGSELKAPMFVHSLHNIKGYNSLSLKAGELAFSGFENAVCYKVEHGTRLISLYGMNLSGKANLTNTDCNREEWGCFGSNIDYPNCPKIGGIREAAVTTVTIPKGHNGIVLFMSKIRLQPDREDKGGVAKMWINIDGKDVGTIGTQGFNFPNGESSRTISASYLSAGIDKLTEGSHIIRLFLKAEGKFKHISYSLDLPLIYLD